jgi:hypothetical protein
MQNEELTKELNLLKEKFSKDIEDLKKKYEKNTFELNKWYISDIGNLAYFENKNDSEYLYGIVDGYFTNSAISYKNLNGNKNWSLSTTQEVEAALTKEYNKRGYERGKWIDLDRKDVTNNASEYPIHFQFIDNKLWVQGCGIVFDNGIWAEIIKEKTFDELASEYVKDYYNKYKKVKTHDSFKLFLTENKKEVINILNNL